jgi:hypothetical protein
MSKKATSAPKIAARIAHSKELWVEPDLWDVLESWEARAISILGFGGFKWPRPPFPDGAERELESLIQKIRTLPTERGRKAALKARERRLCELQRAAGIIPHDAKEKYRAVEELLGLIASIRQLYKDGSYERAGLHILLATELVEYLRSVLPFAPLIRQATEGPARARQARTNKKEEKAALAKRLIAGYKRQDCNQTEAEQRAADEMTKQGYARKGKRVYPSTIRRWLAKPKDR